MKLKSYVKNLLKDVLSSNSFDYYPDAVIIMDSSSNITFWNERAQQIFGYTQEEMIGRNIAILFDSEIEKIFECVETQKIQVLSSKNHLNEDIFVEISCITIPQEDKTIITARDVTNSQKVIQKLLVEYEASEKINSNKNRFIVSLSSDLKTPLHSLIGFSQGLLDSICGELNEKQAKYVTIINKNANNLLDMVDNLLELSNLEADKPDLNLKVFDLIRTLNPMCEKFKQIAENKSLQFEADFHDIVKRNVYSDETMLCRILLNVLENAVKFTEMGSVRLKILHPDIEIFKGQGLETPENFNDKSYLLFKVTDTGIGLSNDETSVIFDEYSQNYRNSIRKYGGTGLKLALTRKMLIALGGTIWVESEPGQGSTFSFIIPIENQAKT
ncbi:MAG: hypothetical protein A2Y25_10325 [Candidatus Melainabacteria bacterium GWF2_37_15]|nr:MAG: hypothetical protein A2Y25_10325 [Candidatus Melainabacteria bacterium GWF2_37_15]